MAARPVTEVHDSGIGGTPGIVETLLAAALCGFYLIVQVGLPTNVAFPVTFPALLVLPLVLFLVNRWLGLILLVTVTLYQNITISIYSDLLASRSYFQALQGINFAVIFSLGIASILLLWLTRPKLSDDVVAILRISVLAFGFILLYTLYGVTQTTVTSAMIYFRYTATAILALWAGIWIGLKYDLDLVVRTFFVIGLGSVALAVIEMLVPLVYYSLIDAPMYHGYKSDRNYRVEMEVIESIVSKRFLNLPLNTSLTSRRFMSTVLHHVSYAYVLAVMSVCALYLRRYAALAFILVMLAINGSKGPIILSGLTIAFFFYRSVSRRRLGYVLLAAIVVYVGSAMLYGSIIGDQHVVGFFSSLSHVARKPVGYGIGVGGNLSALAGEGLAWNVWRQEGSPFALESAVGVLIYQMGLAALAVLGTYYVIVRRGLDLSYRLGVSFRGITLIVAFFVCLINGIFQEEAFSPYALGMITLFCGVMFGNASMDEKSSGAAGGSFEPST